MSLILSKPTSPSPYSTSDKLALELELEYSTAQRTYFKELTYDNISGNLANIGIYESSSKNTKLFNKDFIYTNGALTQILTMRISDNATLIKNLEYDTNDNLISAEVIV